MKKHGGMIIAFLVVCFVVTAAWAATVNKNPYGVAAPRYYGMTFGNTSSLDSYYAAMPTLTANDGITTNAATQTLTNKTLTSPTINTGTIANPTISGTVTGTGVISATNIANVVRYISLQLNAFMVETGGNGSTVGTATAPLSASTTPGLELDDKMTSVVAADGETSPIQVTFRVPADYASDGAFKLLGTESDSTTPNQVDFDVYVNADGVASDSSATDQTPVPLAGTTSTPDEVTLSPATDFAGLAAGNWVTLRLWRDDVADGTGDLEIKGVAFYYTATQ